MFSKGAATQTVKSVTAILVAERDPGVSFFLADAFATELAANVRCAATGTLAARLIEEEVFDLAIIDVGMPEISGFELAKRATNRNIPSLLCSGHQDALVKLNEFHIPHLTKPIMLDQLMYESARAITRARENIQQIKETCARLQATADSLKAAMEASHRLMARSAALVGRKAPQTPATKRQERRSCEINPDGNSDATSVLPVDDNSGTRWRD